MIQEVIQTTLKQINVNFEACMNGQSAVEKVEEYLKEGKMFDLILMDVWMPIMDGYQSSQQIRLLEQTYGIKEHNKHFICGHSSEMNRQVEEMCFKFGMDDIMAKPMNLKTLQKMLAEHDRRRMLKDGGVTGSTYNKMVSPPSLSIGRLSPINNKC